MREAAGYPHRVLSTPAPNALIMAFGETAIELKLRFWIEDAHNGVHNVKSEVLLRDLAFVSAGRYLDPLSKAGSLRAFRFAGLTSVAERVRKGTSYVTASQADRCIGDASAKSRFIGL
jgi:hypothetical protein